MLVIQWLWLVVANIVAVEVVSIVGFRQISFFVEFQDILDLFWSGYVLFVVRCILTEFGIQFFSWEVCLSDVMFCLLFQIKVHWNRASFHQKYIFYSHAFDISVELLHLINFLNPERNIMRDHKNQFKIVMKHFSKFLNQHCWKSCPNLN